MRLRATRFSPSGFSGTTSYKDRVTIVGFVFGYHRDAHGHGADGNCVMAVHFVDGKMDLESAPIGWFKVDDAVSTGKDDEC